MANTSDVAMAQNKAGAAAVPPPLPGKAHGDVVTGPRIAIVGTQGCGKTVFITTLAKRLSMFDHKQGAFLNPADTKTLKYVERNWQLLQSGEWPPLTPAGQSFALEWSFMPGGGSPECRLHLVDMAGHDLRQIFSDDRMEKLHELPADLQALTRYCLDADILVFVVNLGDFIGEGNAEQRTDSEAALHAAMTYLRSRQKRCCLLFAQADLYEDYVKTNGGWQEVARTQLR
jgi:hypothetical protein